jgi:hypothetical protein
MLVDHEVNKRINSELKREDDIITWPTFRLLILKSCLTEELFSRLTSKPGKNWNFSVFQTRPSFEEQKTGKRGGSKNFQTFRQAKNVRWNGLLSLEEEEARATTRKKILKEAPQGVELENDPIEEISLQPT